MTEPFLFDGPADAAATIVLAHGAGAPMDSASLTAIGGGPRLVIGGRSLGGRIASYVADDVQARGLVCLGYPFHPPGDPGRLRTAHLAGLKTPTLIVQGTRDPFGGTDEVAGYQLSPSIRVV